METLVQLIIGGLAVGALYATVGLGISIVFKATELVNFAAGEVAMVSAFTTYALYARVGWPLIVAIVGGVAVGLGIGLFLELGIFRWARTGGIALFGPAIILFGVWMGLNSAGGLVFGYDTVRFPPLFPDVPIHLGNFMVGLPAVGTLALCLAIAAPISLFFKFTRFGTAMRAAAADGPLARIRGISTNKVRLVSWALAGTLCSAAGLLVAPITYLDVNMMAAILIPSLTVAVVGGLDSLAGVMVAGLMIGVLQNLLSGYVSTQVPNLFMFIIIAVVLAIRPGGLFGKVEREG